jgi:Tfp pilus assembly protein PilN
MPDRRSHTRQVIGSLLAAVAVVILVIAVVTMRFGPTSTAELEHRQNLQEERLKHQEDVLKERAKQREDARKD